MDCEREFFPFWSELLSEPPFCITSANSVSHLLPFSPLSCRRRCLAWPPCSPRWSSWKGSWMSWKRRKKATRTRRPSWTPTSTPSRSTTTRSWRTCGPASGSSSWVGGATEFTAVFVFRLRSESFCKRSVLEVSSQHQKPNKYFQFAKRLRTDNVVRLLCAFRPQSQPAAVLFCDRLIFDYYLSLIDREKNVKKKQQQLPELPVTATTKKSWKIAIRISSPMKWIA